MHALILDAGMLTRLEGGGVEVCVERTRAMLVLTAIHDVMKIEALLPTVLVRSSWFLVARLVLVCGSWSMGGRELRRSEGSCVEHSVFRSFHGASIFSSLVHTLLSLARQRPICCRSGMHLLINTKLVRSSVTTTRPLAMCSLTIRMPFRAMPICHRSSVEPCALRRLSSHSITAGSCRLRLRLECSYVRSSA